MQFELNNQSEEELKVMAGQRNSKSNLQTKIKQSEGALSVTTLSNDEFRGGKRGPSQMKAKYKSVITTVKTPQNKVSSIVQRKSSQHDSAKGNSTKEANINLENQPNEDIYQFLSTRQNFEHILERESNINARGVNTAIIDQNERGTLLVTPNTFGESAQ